MTGLMDSTSIGSIFYIVVVLLAIILAYILYWLSSSKKKSQTVVETPVETHVAEPIKRAEVITVEEPITPVATQSEVAPVVGSAPAAPVITEINETTPGEPKKE